MVPVRYSGSAPPIGRVPSYAYVDLYYISFVLDQHHGDVSYANCISRIEMSIYNYLLFIDFIFGGIAL